jgi:hypothetical protein
VRSLEDYFKLSLSVINFDPFGGIHPADARLSLIESLRVSRRGQQEANGPLWSTANGSVTRLHPTVVNYPARDSTVCDCPPMRANGRQA